MEIMKLSDLNSHDVFEFTYANNYDLESFLDNWNENSIYISDEDFSDISNYFTKIVSDFNFWGPNKITKSEWLLIIIEISIIQIIIEHITLIIEIIIIVTTTQITTLTIETTIIDLTTIIIEILKMENLIIQIMEIISEEIMETSIIKTITMETIIIEDQ